MTDMLTWVIVLLGMSTIVGAQALRGRARGGRAPAAQRFRDFWGGFRELHERQALRQRPWEEELLHWSWDGENWQLHGHLDPPAGRRRSTTSSGWCLALRGRSANEGHSGPGRAGIRRGPPQRSTVSSTRRQRIFGLLGVPTSAGSHNAGQDKAPAAWRTAGIVDRLTGRGLAVHDHGDLPVARHRPAARVGGVRDLERVVMICREVADRVAVVRATGQTPLVLGGDCTITLGVVAGLARSLEPGLLYFDGDADLNTPERSDSGILDTMGVTHLLGGGAPELAGLQPRRPLLTDDRLVLFGFDPAELDTHQWAALTERQIVAFPAPTVRERPSAMAARAWATLAERTNHIVLHVDVDALDTGLFPLANFPHFNGLALEEMRTCLDVFGHQPELAAVVITEVNPDHDPDRHLLNDLADVVTHALCPPS